MTSSGGSSGKDGGEATPAKALRPTRETFDFTGQAGLFGSLGIA
jgi:hypothetical protein